MSRLNVLSLHFMGDPSNRLESVRALEYMVPESRSDVNCIVHDANIPFPSYMKEVDYGLIILGPTFLSQRKNEKIRNVFLSEYSFIKDSSACKVAMPQDDYDCAGVLDSWMVDWKIDRIYTVIPDHWDVLYPKYIVSGDIKLGYTAYITDEWISAWSSPKQHELREIDVSYRTHDLSRFRCYLRNLKYSIAGNFVNSVSANNSKIRMDISTSIKDTIPGIGWHSFLENSKFCLATPSGSSVLDLDGEIRIKVDNYLSIHPQATFNEVLENCLRTVDRKYIFSAISPRNIESALAQTVQIATPGNYSGLMIPHDDFILLREDCSNIKDVFRLMNDKVLVNKIKKNFKDKILDVRRLRRSNIVDEILEFAKNKANQNFFVNCNQDKVDKIFKRYFHEMENISSFFWIKRRVYNKICSIVLPLGAKKVARIVRAIKNNIYSQ